MIRTFTKEESDMANIEKKKCKCGEYFYRIKQDTRRKLCPKCFIQFQRDRK